MTETRIIRKHFQTLPGILTRELNTEIKALVQELEMGCCSKRNGYILEIDDINVRSCSVSESNSFLNFDIDYTAVTLKPRVGSLYTARVCLIFEMGILVNVAEIMKVLIPTSSNANFVFDSDLNRIKYKKNNSDVIIDNGDLVRISVTGVQYNESTLSFNCYGVLV